VEVAPVAQKGQQISQGDRVTTVGCNNGGPATAVASQITSINKFLGAPNVQVAGAPVEGRSGGGLFNAQGQVIGVCNAADPTDNEGLYAALASIHEQLDSAGLSAVYAQVRPASHAAPAMAAGMPTPGFAAQNSAAPGGAPLSIPERAALAELQQRNQSAEVICIVRQLDNPSAKSEVITLDHASPEFLQQLATDRQAQNARHLTSLEVPGKRPARQPLPEQGIRWSTSDTGRTKTTLR
jgi:hypothetical protein